MIRRWTPALVSLLVSVVVAAMVARPAAGFRPGGPAIVVDGQGEPLGPLMAVQGAGVAMVIRTIDDRTVVLSVNRDRFVSGFTVASYESSDCSGPPFLRVIVSAMPIVSIVDETTLVAGPTLVLAEGSAVTKTIRSTWTEGPGVGFCTPNSPSSQSVRATVPLLDLSAIPGPFRLR